MKPPSIRPRIRRTLRGQPDAIMDRLRRRLAVCPHCTGLSVGRHAELFVPVAERHIWSPHLSITVEDDAAAGTVIHGRFGPHPQLWTLYMFVGFAIGFALLVGVSWGYAQWAMGLEPWALLSVPVAAALFGLLYLASVVGQRLGAEQILALSSALEDLLEDNPEPRARE